MCLMGSLGSRNHANRAVGLREGSPRLRNNANRCESLSSCAWSSGGVMDSMDWMGSLGSRNRTNCAIVLLAGSKCSSQLESLSSEEVAEQTEYEGLAWVEPPSEEASLESELESESA